MPKFYIDFSGECVIEAEDEDEAIAKFWQMVENDQPLPENLYEIEDVEEKTERGE